MTKLALPVTNGRYSVKGGDEVISVELDGGLPRLRKDIINAASRVTVSWVLTSSQYEYFCAFYETTIENGSLPFTIDLIINTSTKATYTATFVPGSKTLSEQSGGTYVVSAELSVEAVPRDATADAALVAAYNAAHGA